MLFNEIDEEITRRNVNALLSKYHAVKRMAGSYNQKITASYSFEPKSYTGVTSDKVGDAVGRKMKAEEILHEIHEAINCLQQESRQYLYFKYIQESTQYDYQIYERLHIGKDTYYRRIKKAQLEFAEAFKGGELIAFEIES